MIKDDFTVRHIEFVSPHSFETTVERFEAVTGHIDGAIFVEALKASRSVEDFEAQMHAHESTSGFMRFLALDHGAWLHLYGIDEKCRTYTLGNPLIAVTMLKHDRRVGLNVPVRLMIYETKAGEVRLGYDQPSSLMSQLRNAEVTAAAVKLDAKLAALAEQVTGRDGPRV
jgi:uncharacterized protein (DUF302 family)